MTEHVPLHPAAPHHIPFYITGPDGSDPLFTGVVVFLLIIFLVAGIAYFTLHSLPEHMGEKQNSAQMQLISILCVLALFTHNNLFWVLALLIAVIRVPNFLTPLEGIAKSLETLAANSKADKPGPPPPKKSAPAPAATAPSVAPAAQAKALSEPTGNNKED